MELKDDQSLVLNREEVIELARHFHGYFYRISRKLRWERKFFEDMNARGRNTDRVQRSIRSSETRLEEYREWENLYELLFKNKRIKPKETTNIIENSRDTGGGIAEEVSYE